MSLNTTPVKFWTVTAETSSPFLELKFFEWLMSKFCHELDGFGWVELFSAKTFDRLKFTTGTVCLQLQSSKHEGA